MIGEAFARIAGAIFALFCDGVIATAGLCGIALIIDLIKNLIIKICG